MSRLVTASLIGSIEWFRNCPLNWKSDAFNSLRGTLAREPWDPSVAIKKGIAFENDVYRILSNDKTAWQDDKYSENFRKVLKACSGGVFQDKDKMFIDIGKYEYCLYIKEDVLFPNKIIDIKTTKKWGGRSKYLNTIQHELYCLVKKIPDFEYVVGVWEDADDPDNRTLDSVHTAEYSCDNFKELKEKIIERVTLNLQLLETDDELWELYTKKYSRY